MARRINNVAKLRAEWEANTGTLTQWFGAKNAENDYVTAQLGGVSGDDYISGVAAPAKSSAAPAPVGALKQYRDPKTGAIVGYKLKDGSYQAVGG